MGCDIHLSIEIEVNDEWLHLGHPDVNRWYALFEKMAGVRGDVRNAIVRPKGLPNNLSKVTQLYVNAENDDMHTPSWFNLQEIEILETWLRTQDPNIWKCDLNHTVLHTYLFGNGFSNLDYGMTDVRFIFWFDN